MTKEITYTLEDVVDAIGSLHDLPLDPINNFGMTVGDQLHSIYEQLESIANSLKTIANK